MPVVRNPQFYFREGLCWTDINTTYLKCRKKQKSINDVKSMSIYALSEKVTEDFIITLINSTLISYYVDTFINNTQTFQINDARQIPVVIPDDFDLKLSTDILTRAIQYKKTKNNDLLEKLQSEVDSFIYQIYRV